METGPLLFLEPNFKERLWGGNQLAKMFSFTVPAGRIGEAWLISGHQNGASVIKNGPYVGKTLSELYQEHREWFANDPSLVFPLLTKFIDSAEPLSVQVHPNDADARRMANELGKSECWYVLSASEKSYLVLGHRASSKAEMRKWIQDGRWDLFLKTVPVKRGDFVYLPAGTIHAIGPDLVILETQQSSDVTYRLYDYDRLDAQGKPRDLHLEQSIQVATVPDAEVPLCHFGNSKGVTRMIDSPYFTVEKWVLQGKTRYHNLFGRYYLCTILQGSILINNQSARKGDSFIVTSPTRELQMEGDAEMIISYRKLECL